MDLQLTRPMIANQAAPASIRNKFNAYLAVQLTFNEDVAADVKKWLKGNGVHLHGKHDAN